MPAFRACLPELLSDVGKRLEDVAPSYAAFMHERRADVEPAAEIAVELLVALAEQGLANRTDASVWDDDVDRALFEEIGRVQWREGHDIGTLLSAYQLGARLAWRHLGDAAVREGVAPDALSALAEAVFCFVDQLSSASTAGYLEEQAEASAARERSRDELVELLLSDRSNATAVRSAALRAGWPLPATAAIVFIEPQNEIGRSIVSRLDFNCLPVRHFGLFGAIVPDPSAPGRRERLRQHLAGSSAVIGHVVPLEMLAASARIAEVASRLQRSDILTDDPVFVDQHLDAIIVHRDAPLLAALQQQLLAPLAAAPPGSRDALRETLTSWLRHMGDRNAVAADLHVHPQTVRYRMGRLRELFGEELDQPDRRLALTLALAWNP